MENKIYAIGDCHGMFEEVKKIFKIIESSMQHDDTIVMLGDYVDRGPDTPSTVDFIIEKKKEIKNLITLKGNHEDMLLKYLKKESRDDVNLYLHNGGKQTLEQYDKKYNGIPEEHLEFFNNLENYYETKDYIFVHANICSFLTLKEQDYFSLFWDRNMDNENNTGKTIVHGHTPVHNVVFYEKTNRINIDTGMCYNGVKERNGDIFQGKLTCIVLPDKKIIQIKGSI